MPLLIDSGDRDSSDGPGFVRIERHIYFHDTVYQWENFMLFQSAIFPRYLSGPSRTFECDNGIRFRYNRDLKVKTSQAFRALTVSLQQAFVIMP